MVSSAATRISMVKLSLTPDCSDSDLELGTERDSDAVYPFEAPDLDLEKKMEDVHTTEVEVKIRNRLHRFLAYAGMVVMVVVIFAAVILLL